MARLARPAGFTLTQIVPTKAPESVIEAVICLGSLASALDPMADHEVKTLGRRSGLPNFDLLKKRRCWVVGSFVANRPIRLIEQDSASWKKKEEISFALRPILMIRDV